MMPAALLSLILPGALASAAADPTCLAPNPPVSKCRENYMSSPTIPPAPDPDLARLVKEAEAAVDLEREAVEKWLSARRKFREAKAAASAAQGDAVDARLQKAISDYRAAAGIFAKKKAAAETAARIAVVAVTKAYGLTPPKANLNETQAIEHPLQAWSPTYSRMEVYDAEFQLWRLRTPKEHEIEAERLANGGSPTRPALGAVAGRTWSHDGQISIYPAAFSSPDELAATVYHETTHWVDVMAIGGTARHQLTPPAQFFQREVDAYRREAAFLQRLGKKVESQNRLDAAARFEAQMMTVKSLGLTWEDIKKNQTYRQWLGIDWVLQRRQAPNDAVPDTDPDRAALAEISDGARAIEARTRADAEARRREAESGIASGEDRRNVHVRLANAAISCGLTPADTWNMRYRQGQSVFSFPNRGEDSFMSSLLLLAACYAPEDSPPCADAVEILKSRWDDRAFRDGLYLLQGSAVEPAGCVAGLVNEMAKPGSYKDILKARDRYWKRRYEGQSGGAMPGPNPTNGGSTPGPREPRDREPAARLNYEVPWCLQAPGRRCIR